MKNSANLIGAKTLNKEQQHSINDEHVTGSRFYDNDSAHPLCDPRNDDNSDFWI